jgi:anoctamin-10
VRLLQYEDSLIVKIFVFLFVNSYASFYYLAFLAESVHDCPASGCMYPLAINLAVVFGTSLASSATTQLLLPWLTYQYHYHYASRQVGRDGKGEMTRPESEHLLALVSARR